MAPGTHANSREMFRKKGDRVWLMAFSRHTGASQVHQPGPQGPRQRQAGPGGDESRGVISE